MRLLLLPIYLAAALLAAFIRGFADGAMRPDAPEPPPYKGPERRRAQHNRGGCDLD
jgi:hypothetical protein